MSWTNTTTSGLLSRLFDPEEEQVWEEFDQRYRPVLLGMGRRLGLHELEADEAAQETLVRFLQAYRAGCYDRQRYRLRAWMSGIARHCIADVHRARALRGKQRGYSALETLPVEAELEEIWDAECRSTMLRRALDALQRDTRLNGRTMTAFRLLVLEQKSPAQVAEELELGIDSVYQAKNRCARKLRPILEELKTIYEAD